MNVNGINAYTTLSSLMSSAGSSDPLLETDDTKNQSDLFPSLGTDTSSSLSDSVDFSQTAGFFSKLQQLEESDPDKFKEVAKKLGERLLGAGAYEEQALEDLAQQVADGTDITAAIENDSSSSGTNLYTSTGATTTDQAKQFLYKILSSMNSVDQG